MRVFTFPSKGMPGLYTAGTSSKVTVLMLMLKLVRPLPFRMTPTWKHQTDHSSLINSGDNKQYPAVSQPTCAVFLHFSIHLKAVIVHGLAEGKLCHVHSLCGTTTFICLESNNKSQFKMKEKKWN